MRARLVIRRLRVRTPPPPAGSATFFRGDWSWNIFYGHSLPSADSRRAVVSFWRKNVHNTVYPLRGLSLPSKGVVKPASVAQLDASSDWRPGGCGFNPRRGRQHSFVETDHEIFSTVILSLPLIQEGQLSVSGERMCTILVNRLED